MRLAAVTCALWLANAVALAAGYAGRSVQDVLHELGQGGVEFIYNTELVPADLRVEAEPAPGTPLDIARQVLAAHGLALSAAGGNVYAIVPARRAEAPPAEGVPLEEIVVATSRYELAAGEAQFRHVLTHADVQSQPKLADEPLRSVQRLPGSAVSGVTALTHLRGGDYDEVLTVLDGLPLTEPFHMRNFLAPVSLFDAEAIGSLDVSSGGFTADHGERMSGVIDVTSLAPPEERWTVLGLSLFHASALSAGTFADERGTWLASVRRSNLDVIFHAADADFGEPEYFDAFGTARFALSDASTFTAGLLTARDELEANTDHDTKHALAEYRNTYVWGGWEQRWARRWSSRLIVGLTDLDTEREGTIVQPGAQQAEVDESRTLRSALARLDVSHEAERLYTRFGVEGRESRAEYDYHSVNTLEPGYPFPDDPGGTVTRNLDPGLDGHQFAAWLTTRARFGERLTVEAGLRWDGQTYDDADESGPEQFAPRLNFRYDIAPDTRLRGAWGRFWQAQGMHELQVEDGIDTFHEPQRADHLILSLERDLPADLSLRIELYRKDYAHVRPHFENLFDPVELLPELEPDRVEVAPSDSLARGVELLVSRRNAGPWSWWLSYAWSRVTDSIDGADVPRSWDQRHSINAGLRYSGDRWEFTLADSFHTGWPTTAVFTGPGGEPAVGERNATRFGDYNSLDLRIARRFALPASTLEAFFEMTNALARGNDCCTDYEIEATAGGPVIIEDRDHWPRLIPSLGVLWRF